MTEDKNEAVAVFRFGVIHEFIGGASNSRFLLKGPIPVYLEIFFS